MRGFYLHVSTPRLGHVAMRQMGMELILLTLGAFLLPAFPWGKGAGAAFLPDLGGYH